MLISQADTGGGCCEGCRDDPCQCNICLNHNTPNHISFTGSGYTTAGGIVTCSSSASDSAEHDITFPDGFGNCQFLEELFPSTDYVCTAPACSSTTGPNLTSFFYAISLNPFTFDWGLDVRGTMENQSIVPGCPAQAANGTEVAPATINLGNDPLGTHNVNFDDGVSFFSYTIIVSII